MNKRQICKVCVTWMSNKFIFSEDSVVKLDEHGEPEMEQRCMLCGSTTSGVTILEIFQQIKDNVIEINDFKERLSKIEEMLK